MAVYVVTWNLNKEKSNYNVARDEFIRHLERLDNTKDPGLESVRWVSATMTAEGLNDYFRQKLDNNDRLFVSKLYRNDYSGWLTADVWTWISARL